MRRPRLFRSPLTPWTKSAPAAVRVDGGGGGGGGGIGRPPHVRVVCGESCPKLRIPRAPPGSLSPGSLFARAHCPAQSIAARGRRGHFGLPPRPRRVSFHRAIFYSSSILYPHPACCLVLFPTGHVSRHVDIYMYTSSSVYIYIYNSTAIDADTNSVATHRPDEREIEWTVCVRGRKIRVASVGDGGGMRLRP